METFVPQPPTKPYPDNMSNSRPGVRYLRRGSLPPLSSKEPTVAGISKRAKSSGAFPREGPPTPSSAHNNPARHTAKSRARAAFLEGERAKFDEMFPPLTKTAPDKSLLKDGTLSYSEVARGVPAGGAKSTTQPPARPKPEELSSESHQLELPRQRSYSEVVQRRAETVAQPSSASSAPQQHALLPALVEQLSHPETVQRHPQERVPQPAHPETVQPQPPHPKMGQQQPHPGAVVPAQPPHPQVLAHPQRHCPGSILPIPLPMVRTPFCLPALQQQQGCVARGQVPFCTPVFQHRWYPWVHPYPLVAVPQPPRPRQKRQAEEEDFETLLARRKEEYARVRAEKEKLAEVLEGLWRTSAETEAFIARHPEQVAKLTLRKSVEVEEAKEAQRKGDLKREHEVLQAHLKDLAFNKDQILAQLSNEEREKEDAEKSVQEEIEKLNDNDEIIIERTMQIVRDMLNEAGSSEEDEEEGVEGEEGEVFGSGDEDTRSDYTEDNEDNEEDDDEDTLVPAEQNGLPPTDSGTDEATGVSTAGEQKELSPADGTPNSDQEGPSYTAEQRPLHDILRELDGIAREVEGDVLGDLAKLGRLMKMEAAHNGKDNAEMLDMVSMLLGMIETDLEAKQGEDDDESSATDSDCDSEELTEVSETLESADSQEAEDTADGTATEGEEDAGPIMPAFTSTSINLSSADSKAAIEALKSGEMEQNWETESDRNVPSLEPEADTAPNRTGGTGVCLCTEGRVAKEDSKGGKKQVSFVPDEPSGPSERPQRRRSSTVYARMSANDLADLVSSSLASDIMSYYASPNSDACCFEDGFSEAGSADDQPVIAVKYLSVVTTEKNKSKLRPAFGGRSDARNVLSFTIKGEILLSTLTDEPESSSKAEPGTGGVTRPTTASTWRRHPARREGESTETNGTGSTQQKGAGEIPVESRASEKGSPLTGRVCDSGGECECAEGPRVSWETEGPSGAQGSGGDTPRDPRGSSHTPREDPDTTGQGVAEDSETTADSKPERSEVNKVAKDSNGATESENAAVPKLEISGHKATESEATAAALELESSKRQNNTCGDDSCSAECCSLAVCCDEKEEAVTSETGDSRVTFDADSARALVESNGLRLEFDVAALCSAMYRTVQQQLVPQLALEAAPITLDKTAFEAAKVMDTEGGTEAAKPEERVASTDGAPEEKPPAPYVFRMVTPSIFCDAPVVMPQTAGSTHKTGGEGSQCTAPAVFPANGQSTGKDADTAADKPRGEPDMASPPEAGGGGGDGSTEMSVAGDVDRRTTDSGPPNGTDSGNSLQKTAANESAPPSDMDASGGTNTETAVVPYDSQIVTIKAMKALAVQTSPGDGSSPPREDHDQAGPDSTMEQVLENGGAPPVIEPEPGSPAGAESTFRQGDDNDGGVGKTCAVGTEGKPGTEAQTVPTELTTKLGETETQPPTTKQNVEGDRETEKQPPTTKQGVEGDRETETQPPTTKQDVEGDRETETQPPTTKQDVEGDSAVVDGGVGESRAADETHGCTTNQGMATGDVDLTPTASENFTSPGGTPTATKRSVTSGGGPQKTASNCEDSATFFSRLRKSLASFRRCDLEEAVAPPDKRGPDEKLKLRQTQSKPVTVPIEPPREPLLPRRAKMNRMYQSPAKPRASSSRRGPLKANGRGLPQRDSLQTVPETGKEKVVVESGSGVKSSKSFRSQSSLVAADVAASVSDTPGNPVTWGLPEGKQSSQDGPHGQASSRAPADPLDSSERLYKPRSLPASLGEPGNRRSKRVRKSRSEKLPHLPQL